MRETVIPLMVFASVMTITPGPNNVLLLASGLTFGFRRTGWHIAGILVGLLLMIAMVGAGLGAAFARLPESQVVLKLAGSLYMVWMADRLWLAAGTDAVALVRPIRFGEAVAFQFFNPKVWLMGVTVISAFVPSGGNYALRVALIGVLYCATAFPCICVWVVGGEALRRWIQDRVARKWLNRVMALMALATVVLFWT